MLSLYWVENGGGLPVLSRLEVYRALQFSTRGEENSFHVDGIVVMHVEILNTAV